MADEYIRKQDAVDMFNRAVQDVGILDADDIEIVFGMLSSADVVPVVRCKDCKHVHCRIYHGWQEPIYTCTHLRSRWNTDNDLEVNPDDFCSYGEMREDTSNG